MTIFVLSLLDLFCLSITQYSFHNNGHGEKKHICNMEIKKFRDVKVCCGVDTKNEASIYLS